MLTGEHDLSATVEEQVEECGRRLEEKFAAIEKTRKKILHTLDRTDGDLAKIHAILAEMRQHLSRPEDR